MKRQGRKSNGEGTIYLRKDGRWEARLTLPNGNSKWISNKDKAIVEQRVLDARYTLYKGLPIPGEQLTVAAFLASWLDNIKTSIKPSTWERYQDFVRLHIVPEVGRVSLVRLSPQQVQGLYTRKLSPDKETGKALSATTVHHIHTVLHTALTDALKKGLVARNVTEAVTPPRMQHKEMQPLSAAQAEQFLASIEGNRLEALYILAITTGMRQGELLALHWHDVKLEAAEPYLQVRASLRYRHQEFSFSTPKTARSRRDIKLTPMAIAALHQHKARQGEERMKLGEAWQGAEKREDDVVFTHHWGGPMDASNLLKYCFYPALKKAGLPRIRFHDLRHTFATLQLADNTNPKIVSAMLGHSSIAITLDTYSHPDLAMQEVAVQAMERRFQKRSS